MIDDVSNNLNSEDFKKIRIYSNNKNYIKNTFRYKFFIEYNPD